MGASRKLQGEIDRVLKKVNEGVDEFDAIWNKVHDTENANLKEKFEGDLKKEIKKLQRHRDQIKTWQQSSEIKDKKVGPSYEQALMDSRKLIEREMERFKVFEKETKTKAFSKEGLGQQPKTDPKEKARSETRDWLNNVVGDLESQIDNFEAELEGISVKKGKTRNPQLTHLETSIARHKAHIMKLELILRLLDNDELSPDEINEIKYLLDEYVECNQVNFDQYSDIDELYATLPLDKVEALEDLVIQGSSGIVKAALLSSAPQNADQAQSDEITYQESNLETVLKPASPEAGATVPTVPSSVPEGPSLATISNASVHTLLEGPACPAVLSDPASIQSVPAESADSATSSIPNQSNAVEDINSSFPACSASIIADVAPEKCISREISNQDPVSVPLSLTSVGAISSNGGLDSVPVVSDLSKNFFSRVDERMIGGITPSVSSPLSTRVLLQQGLRINDGTNSNDTHKVGEDLAIGGRVFPHSVGSTEWSPQTAAAFKNQNEGQIRTRPEISPDQREKYLQRLQQVQQQGHTTLLSVPNLPAANHKQLLMQQENSILQQLNSQSVPPQLGLALNVQSSALSSVSNAQLQFPIHQLSSQNLQISAGAKDLDTCHSKREELQQQQSFFGDKNAETFMNSGFTKIMSDDNLSTPLMIGGSSIMTGGNQLTRENDLLPGQLRQYSQPSANHGVIGRNVSNHYTSGDKLRGSVGNFGGYDPAYNLQLLEAALHHLPQPKDSEFVKSYVPRHPATTPASFPQTQAEIINNPAFWKRLGLDEWGTDTLFFAFYHQQNTYQQYLAARELKRNSWRYHNQYNTWFQRHKEPEDATDDYETGTYVYYDFHIQDGSPQQGWCQRIKTNFTFEYKYLEDELVV